MQREPTVGPLDRPAFHAAVDLAQVGDELAQRPAGIPATELAGTASRPIEARITGTRFPPTEAGVIARW